MIRIRHLQIVIGLTAIVVGALIFCSQTGVREIAHSKTANTISQSPFEPQPGDWPCWRGRDANNSLSQPLPTVQWSDSESVCWKTVIPGRGHSSPCLWQNQIFLTTTDETQQTISLIALEKQTGKQQWQTELQRDGLPTIHKKNSHTSSTPACDGQSVFVARIEKGNLWVTAVAFDGSIRWECDAGAYSSEWGYGSSVAIFQSIVIVSADNRGHSLNRLMGTSWLAGIHRKTGQIAWRVKRPEGDSFGTPIVANVAGRDQLLLAGKDHLVSYNPENGQTIWTCRWDMKRTANTVTFDEQHVYATGRQPGAETICVRADGDGDVTETHLVWREKKVACDVPSPIISRSFLYVLTDEGVLNCLNSKTGKTEWKRRLGGNMSASPLVAGNHLLCSNEDGKNFVLDLEHRGEIVAENSLNEGIMASPVLSENRLYLRTHSSLYCFASDQHAPLADASADQDRLQ